MGFIGVQPTSAPLTSSDIADDIVNSDHLGNTTISGFDALTTEPADTDEFLISDGGVLKRIDASLVGGSSTADTFFASSGLSAKDLGSGLHIKTGDSGNSVDATFDELVIEGSSNGGMTFAMGNSSSSVIAFSNSNGTDDGNIIYRNIQREFRISTAGSEKIRIPSDKGIFINTTSRTGPTNVLSVLGDSTEDVMHVRTPADSGAVNGIAFTDGDGTDCGEIVINPGGNTLSYNTSSDYRLKENVNYDFEATSRLKQLKPSRFNWISKPDTTVDGFLAHEVSSIVPEAINGTKDETKTVTNAVISKRNALITGGVTEAEWEQGKIDNIYPNDSTWSASKEIPKHQSIDQAKLVPLLTKALQEAITKIEALETRVATLEG